MTNLTEDEIESIEYIGEEETIDINVSGNRLFYANDILTHNSAVEEIEFDHSHISGGLSKIMTADNVIGIFTSRAMKERGRFQIQFMKTRNSSGVGQKVDLEFNLDTLRISDLADDTASDSPNMPSGKSIFSSLKRTSSVSTASDDDRAVATPRKDAKKQPASGAPGIRKMLAGLSPEKD